MDYCAMIQNRKSVRAFLDTPVPAWTLDEIRHYFATDCKRLIPSIDVEMRIFGSDVKERLEGSAGYQNFMIGAPCYLVLLSQDAEYAVENAGYITEDLVLKMTELNLNTCWITFYDSDLIKDELGISSDKNVCAIVAFGHGAKTSRNIRLNIKNMSNIDVCTERGYYAPKLGIEDMVSVGKWGESAGLYELIGDMDRTLWRAFYGASLSPSYLNRQPYGFVIDGGKIILISKPDDCTDEMNQKLNLGIVMLHFAAIVEQRMYNVPWSMGASGEGLGLPAGCKAVAHCDVYK